jgi:hypothetical protein
LYARAKFTAAATCAAFFAATAYSLAAGAQASTQPDTSVPDG